MKQKLSNPSTYQQGITLPIIAFIWHDLHFSRYWAMDVCACVTTEYMILYLLYTARTRYSSS